MVAISQPTPESQTPESHRAVFADPNNQPPAPSGGEPVPISISASAPTAPESQQVTPGATVEPTAATAQPASGFGITAEDLTDRPLPTTADTAAHPDATATLEGNASIDTTKTPPAAQPSTTPAMRTAPEVSQPHTEITATPTQNSAESIPSEKPAEAINPAIAVSPDGLPTGSQELAPGDKLVVSDSEQAAEIAEFQQWVNRARDGLRDLLQKEADAGALNEADLQRKRLFLAVLQVDANEQQN